MIHSTSYVLLAPCLMYLIKMMNNNSNSLEKARPKSNKISYNLYYNSVIIYLDHFIIKGFSLLA